MAATLPLRDSGPLPSADEAEHESQEDIDRLQRAARRRFRGWTVALVALPVTFTAVLVLMAVGPMSVALEGQTLPAEELERIEAGDTLEETEPRLPADAIEMTTVERRMLGEPEGAECFYFHDGSSVLDVDAGYHRVCFRDERVVEVGAVGGAG